MSRPAASREGTLSITATQIFTLVGVLIGALTSYFAAAAVAERARFRRELATRWDERKLDTYIEYVTCVRGSRGPAWTPGGPVTKERTRPTR